MPARCLRVEAVLAVRSDYRPQPAQSQFRHPGLFPRFPAGHRHPELFPRAHRSI